MQDRRILRVRVKHYMRGRLRHDGLTPSGRAMFEMATLTSLGLMENPAGNPLFLQTNRVIQFWCERVLHAQHLLHPTQQLRTHIQGLVNVPIEHHPTIGDRISNRYGKVMFKITNKGHLPTPVCPLPEQYAFCVMLHQEQCSVMKSSVLVPSTAEISRAL